MLLAGRQRQHEPAPPVLVDGLAAKPAGHLADEFLPCGEQPEIGTAEIEPVADRLPFGNDDVGAHRAGRAQRAERDRLGDHDDQQRAVLVRQLGKRRQIARAAEQARILDDDAGGFGIDVIDQFGVRRGRQRDDLMLRVAADRFDHVAVMRVQIAEQQRLLPPRDAMRHQHRFGRRRRAVIHGGVGHFHAGERRDLGLELEQILQRSLRDLRLIGRVRRHEFGALDNVIDGCGHMMLIGAAADEEGHRASRGVAPGQLAERPLDRHLALMAGQSFDPVDEEFGGNVGKQRVDGVDADFGEHLAALVHRMRKIAHQSTVSR